MKIKTQEDYLKEIKGFKDEEVDMMRWIYRIFIV